MRAPIQFTGSAYEEVDWTLENVENTARRSHTKQRYSGKVVKSIILLKKSDMTGTSHTRPLDTESPNIFLTIYMLFVLSASNEEPLLDTSAQTTTSHQRQQIKLLIPIHAIAQEVTVEAQWITRISCVSTAKPDARGHKVAFGMEVLEQRIRDRNLRQRQG
jgi:hypothetical protein